MRERLLGCLNPVSYTHLDVYKRQVLQPVEEIGTIAAEADVYFHTDAVQAAGKIPIDVKRIGCDALSISGHKMHAPQGVGALYVRRGTRLQPLFYGGRHERCLLYTSRCV